MEGSNMSKSSPPIVFIDTTAFIREALDFAGPLLSEVGFAASCGAIELILTDVTVFEVRRKIRAAHERAGFELKAAMKRIRSFKAGAANSKQKAALTHESSFVPVANSLLRLHYQIGVLSDPIASSEAAATAHEKQFTEWLTNANVTIASSAAVPFGVIFDLMKNGKPPFENSDKQAEWRDAAAFQALREEVGALRGRKVLVISEDQDWNGMCQGRKGYTCIKLLKELKSMYEEHDPWGLVTRYCADIADLVSEDCAFLLADECYSLAEYSVDEDLVDVEIEDVEIQDADADDIKRQICSPDVVTLEGWEQAESLLKVALQVKYAIEATWDYPEPGTSSYDSEDGEFYHHIFEARKVRYDCEAVFSCEVYLLAKGESHEVTLSSLSMTSNQVINTEVSDEPIRSQRESRMYPDSQFEEAP